MGCGLQDKSTALGIYKTEERNPKTYKIKRKMLVGDNCREVKGKQEHGCKMNLHG